MKIMPVGMIKSMPAFLSRSRSGQDNAYKLYQSQTRPLSDSDAYMTDRSLLFQKFDFHEAEKEGVDAQNRTYDSFTGLRDKNYLLASLYVAMQEAQRDGRELSIAMFDMDNFKSVNEFLGYETGDTFIKEVSREISQIGKENNVDVYRFGGEEFIIIFDNQTEEEKEKIANTIAHKANTNSIIQSYRNLYTRNAQSRLDKALYSTSKVHKISELKTKKATLKEVAENLVTKEAKNDPYLLDEINSITSQIEMIYRNLLSECIPKEQDYKTRAILITLQAKLMSDTKLLTSEQEYLDEYLYCVYDKANTIYQTKKWISDFNQNGGFGITCGVVNFEPESLEYKDPMDVIEKAGKVLKRGKDKKKGQVYYENIKL